jgi:hypothetical protein
VVSGQQAPFVGGNSHFVLGCDPNTGRYNGVYLPSLKRFTLSLPASFSRCAVQVGAHALYTSSAPADGRAVIAEIPAAPPTKAPSRHTR